MRSKAENIVKNVKNKLDKCDKNWVVNRLKNLLHFFFFHSLKKKKIKSREIVFFFIIYLYTYYVSEPPLGELGVELS